MSTKVIYYCDAPDCKTHGGGVWPGMMPMGFVKVTSNESPDSHFCNMDCLMKYAAQWKPPETFDAGEFFNRHDESDDDD